MSGWNPTEEKPASVRVGEVELCPGDRVRLWPAGGADVMDRFLWGRTATILSIEQDYENHVHLAVTADDDPGAELGAAGMVGHRFFFRPEEVEPLDDVARVSSPWGHGQDARATPEEAQAGEDEGRVL